MDVDEFLTWAAYQMLEPFPEQRADVHVAMLMAQNYNMNRPAGRAAKHVENFIPIWHRPAPREMSLDQQRAALQAQFLAWRGNPEDLQE